MTEQPSFVRAICLSFLGLALFCCTNFFAAVIVGVIISFLAQIPVLNIVAAWMSRFLGQDSLLIPACGYFVSLTIVCRLSKGKATADLTCILLGAYLLITSAICLILNLIYGNPIWINVIYAIAGILFIFRQSEDVD